MITVADANVIVDIAPLAANTGLGTGDSVNISDNCLDLSTPGTTAYGHVHELETRGVAVVYAGQKTTCTIP